MAGVQSMPGMRLNVRSHVRVPDAEAGCEAMADRRPYYAEGPVTPTPRLVPTVPRNIAAIFLVALLVGMLTLVLVRYSKLKGLNDDINAMERSIVQTLQDNTQLAVEVMEARDSSRICYAAAQNLGMVASNGMDAVPVTAPDTRPYQTHGSLTASSPLADGRGIMTGSR